MDYTTLPPLSMTVNEATQPDLTPAHSLYEALQGLPDFRRGQGKRYELALLLCLLLLTKLAGQTTLSGATEWVRHRCTTPASLGRRVRGLLPIRRCRYCEMVLAHSGLCIELDALRAGAGLGHIRWSLAGLPLRWGCRG